MIQTETTELALAGLERMYDPLHRLFAHTVEYRSGQPTLQGTSIRDTAISLLGLIRAYQAGCQQTLDAHEVLAGLMAQVDRCRNVGDLGLILWNYALIPEEYPAYLWRMLRHHYSLMKTGGGLMRAIELEWLLTGLSYVYQQWPREPIFRLAQQVYHALLGYYFHPTTGLFSCASEEGGARVKSISRQRLGFLAEQAYGIYTFANYAAAFEDPLAAEYALLCAHRLTALQGDQGQWWWRYNVYTGKVASRYPLFPVHQEAIMPMALGRLSEVTGESFEDEIRRGREWIRTDTPPPVIDWDAEVIWHNVQPKAPWNLLYYLNGALSLLHGRCISAAPHCVPSTEARPQDLGWILYARNRLQVRKDGCGFSTRQLVTHQPVNRGSEETSVLVDRFR